ncbi:GGDEF domain-containing protein [Pelagibacterium montanilacus]|uniref:GGDEF domain-containing protein n=1 Tax=Pelagibacterium montanilacus TaxID=2185280 RepID=UPI000F8C3783|nr:GGDEF domain-containing protein [Pelagibacterium montanilacus]
MPIPLDSQTLFLANALILLVAGMAFLSAYRSQERASYWLSWTAANLVLAAALVLLMFQFALPAFVIGPVGHGALLLGFGLRLKAARQFSGRGDRPLLYFGPAVAFSCICLIPAVMASPGLVFAGANTALAIATGLVIHEFARDRADGLPSRLGLIVVYALMAASFAARAAIAMFDLSSFEHYLPRDGLLVVHLVIAIIHVSGSAVFAITLSYERAAKNLRRDARSDALTGLFNRRAFEERMLELLDDPRKPAFALVLFDVDHFKAVNDAHGHGTGDAALRRFAEVLRSVVRDTDMVARIGGEEFGVIMPSASGFAAMAAAEGVRARLVHARIEGAPADTRITVSAGIACHEAGPTSVHALLTTVDEALYRAKRNGRNRVEAARTVAAA